MLRRSPRLGVTCQAARPSSSVANAPGRGNRGKFDSRPFLTLEYFIVPMAAMFHDFYCPKLCIGELSNFIYHSSVAAQYWNMSKYLIDCHFYKWLSKLVTTWTLDGIYINDSVLVTVSSLYDCMTDKHKLRIIVPSIQNQSN